MVKVLKKRPCRICRKWFLPNPRAGDRQKVCSRPECQRKRNSRASAAWRRRNPDCCRSGRLRARVKPIGDTGKKTLLSETPLSQVRWVAVQNAVGLDVAVITEEIAEVLYLWVQNAVGAEIRAVRGFARQLLSSTVRTQIAENCRPP
jgi:hypothetical protein